MVGQGSMHAARAKRGLSLHFTIRFDEAKLDSLPRPVRVQFYRELACLVEERLSPVVADLQDLGRRYEALSNAWLPDTEEKVAATVVDERGIVLPASLKAPPPVRG